MGAGEAKFGLGRWVAVSAVAVALGVVAWLFWRAGYDWRAVLEGMEPWMFFLAMATLPVFGFPISVCYVYAGVAYDLGTALAACWGALAVNMSVSYWLTRLAFRETVRRLLARRGWKAPELKGDTALRVTFLVRTVPGPPFFFQNLGLALAEIPFGTYLWVSLLAQGSIAAGVVYCTGTLSRDPGSVGGIVALVVVFVLVVLKLVKWLVRRHRQRAQAV